MRETRETPDLARAAARAPRTWRLDSFGLGALGAVCAGAGFVASLLLSSALNSSAPPARVLVAERNAATAPPAEGAGVHLRREPVVAAEAATADAATGADVDAAPAAGADPAKAAPVALASTDQRRALQTLRAHLHDQGLPQLPTPTTPLAWRRLDDVHALYADDVMRVGFRRSYLAQAISHERSAAGLLVQVGASGDRKNPATRRAMKPQFAGQYVSVVSNPKGIFVCRINPGDSAEFDEVQQELRELRLLYHDAATRVIE